MVRRWLGNSEMRTSGVAAVTHIGAGTLRRFQPTIADADPQVAGAVRLASWAGLNLTAVDVGNLRLAMMGLLPNLAGLVLAFGVALRSWR